MKTFSAKPSDIERRWLLIDASEATLGRLSTIIANHLTGKNKPSFTKHIDCGDYVVVINAKNINITGNKLKDKKYYRHSGYPGGIKTTTLQQAMNKDPNKVIQKAVRGMLPDNKLRDDRLNRLKVFTDNEHDHKAQKPVAINLKGVVE